MKNLKLLALPLLLAFAAPALAQQTAAAQAQQKQATGASSVKDLALLLHSALQNSNFDPLSQYMPTKQVYDQMLQLSEPVVREQLMLYPPDQMLMDFQKDFMQVLRDGVTLDVSWPKTTVQSITAEVAPGGEASIIPVKLTLLSPTNLPLQINFNAARLGSSYYYLEPLQVQNKDFIPIR